MNSPKPRRIHRTLTARQQAGVPRNRRRIDRELPELAAADQMRKEARDEPTFSGELRRAIHASSLSLADIAEQTGISPITLDEFLTGERTLRSDVLDRLTKGLGLVLSSNA
ncbi:MAG: helix-turn-helix domain-containing protein [Phycisphaerales bacterium]